MPKCTFSFFSLSGLWVDDEAVYVCEAHNQFGKIEAQARVTVTGLGRCSSHLMDRYVFLIRCF